MSLLVAFEGLPNCGKSIISQLLKEELCSSGVMTEVLDADTIDDAPQLRKIAAKYQPGHSSRIFLYWILHIQQEDAIKKHCRTSQVIIIDRFWGSLEAFDYYGNNVPETVIKWITSFASKPDITFFLDLPLGVANGRKKKKPAVMSDAQFAQRVKTGYRKLATIKKWVRIDAAQNKRTIKDQCLKIIYAELKRRNL